MLHYFDCYLELLCFPFFPKTGKNLSTFVPHLAAGSGQITGSFQSEAKLPSVLQGFSKKFKCLSRCSGRAAYIPAAKLDAS